VFIIHLEFAFKFNTALALELVNRHCSPNLYILRGVLGIEPNQLLLVAP
jgi:hypothetical protein